MCQKGTDLASIVLDEEMSERQDKPLPRARSKWDGGRMAPRPGALANYSEVGPHNRGLLGEHHEGGVAEPS